MRQKLGRSIAGIVCSLAGLASAQVNVGITGATSTQAVLRISGATGVCRGTLTDMDSGEIHSYVADADLSTLENYILWQDGTRIVTLGRNQGNDALRTETNYRIVLSGSGCSGSASFRTARPFFGPQPAQYVPFDRSRFGNRAWPNIDWSLTGKDKAYNDPLTGVKLTILPATGDLGYKSVAGGLPFSTWAGGNGWTNPGLVGNGSQGSYGTVTGNSGPVDLFVPMDQAPWQYSSQAFPHSAGALDNLGILVWCGGDDPDEANRQFIVGVHNGEEFLLQQTISCPEGGIRKLNSNSGDLDKPWPSRFEDGGFAGWLGSAPLSRNLLPQDGSLTVSGSGLNIEGTNSGSHFPARARSGNRILIKGAGCPENELCTISDVFSASQAAIQETIPAGTYPYVVYPWQLRIQKTTSTGTLHVGVRWKAQGTGNIIPSVVPPIHCAPHAVIEGASSKTGSYCAIGGGMWYFISDDVSVTRMFSIFYQHDMKFTAMPPADRVPAGSQTPIYPVYASPKDPKVFYHATYTGGKKLALYRITYTGDFSKDYKPGLSIGWNNSFDGRNPPPADEMRWENIMPPSQNRDLASQVDAIAPQGPEFQGANWNQASLDAVTETKGFFRLISHGAIQDGGPCLIAVVDLASGTVQNVFSTASGVPAGASFPATARWGSCHSVQTSPVFPDSVDVTMNILQSPGKFFGGPFEVKPTHIKMEDGSWSTNTALNWPIASESNKYDKTCPTDIADWLKDFGATGNQCVTFRLPHDPCNVVPSAQALAQQVPCPSYPNLRTMPQALRVGDRVYDEGTGEGNGRPGIDTVTEHFRVVKITPLPGPEKEVVFARNAVWDFCCMNDAVSSPRSKYCLQIPWQAVHVSGWTMRMTSGQTNSCGSTDIMLSFDPAGGVTYTGEATPSSGGHSALGEFAFGLKLFAGLGNSRIILGPWDLHTKFPPESSYTQRFPQFAGATASFGTNLVQAYYNRAHVKAAWKDLEWTMDANALNNRFASSPIGPRSLTPLTGFPNIYTIQVLGPLDYKRKPLLGWAGVNVLKDVSPEDIRTAPAYSFCHVYKAGDCGTGTKGQTLVKVPNAYNGSGQCESGNYWANVPCVFSGEPVSGWVRRMVSHRNDPDGKLTQNLTMGLAGPGFPGPYWTAVPSPKGTFGGVYSSTHLDGLRSAVVLFKLPDWQDPQPIPRNDFGRLSVNVAGKGVTHARVRFGYNTSFFCTARAEACLTDSKVAPFAFDNSDTLTPQPCAEACSLTIPVIPGRLVYYRVELYDGTNWRIRPTRAWVASQAAVETALF